MIQTPLIKKNIFFLYYFDEIELKYKEIGTGFALHIERPGQFFVYLITCKHVVKPHLDQGRTIHTRLERVDKTEVEYVALTGGWIYHEDESVDLAATTPLIHDPPDYISFAIANAEHILLSDERLEHAGHRYPRGR